MAEQNFLSMVKTLALEIQSSLDLYKKVKSNCSNKRSYEELFGFIWNLKEAPKVISPTLIPSAKSETAADRLRDEGNTYYKKKLLEKALELYNLSIMEAPHPLMSHSDKLCEVDEREGDYLYPLILPSRYGGVPDGESIALAKGFANRSAVMYELKLYEESISDIYLALKYGYPQDKQNKLETRRFNCETELSKTLTPKKDFEDKKPSTKASDELQISLSKPNEDLTFCEKLLSSLQIIKDEEKPTVSPMFSYQVRSPPNIPKRNETIPSLSRAVDITYIPSKGRCLIAARDITPGEVLGVEDAHSISIEEQKLPSHCSRCLRLTLTPLPCPSCTKVVFCNESCRLKGLTEDHWLECAILPTLISLDMSKRNLIVKMLKSLTYSHLSDFVDHLKIEEHDNPEKEPITSASYRSVHNLCSNKKTLTFEFIFMQCQIALVITKLLYQSGRFFINSKGEPVEPSAVEIVKLGAVLLFYDIQLYCNPYQIYDSQLKESVGAGVFPALSLINHSCFPSVRHYTCGRSLVIRSIRPIPSGKELTVSYISEFQKLEREERQSILSRYKFSCTCEACENSWPTFTDLPALKLKCLDCSTPIEGRLRLCPTCTSKNTDPETKQVVLTPEQQEEIEKTWNGVLGACSLDLKLSNGVVPTEKDYIFACETIQLLFKRVVMPCQHVVILQNLLYKCFEEGF